MSLPRISLSVVCLGFAAVAAGCGLLDPNPPIEPATFQSISAGREHTCAVDPDGNAYCWGRAEDGRLGIGTTGGRSSEPTAVATNRRYTSIAAGEAHSCALADDGSVFCWGSNLAGQLGDGTETDRSKPVKVLGSSDLRYRAISAALGRFTCGLNRRDGFAFCWGRNDFGQLGDGTGETTSEPTLVELGLFLQDISTGGAHTCALDLDGTALCWGLNDDYGQLGIGSNAFKALGPVKVAGGHTFASLDAGNLHTCALDEEGQAYCWGRNRNGEVGTGSTGGPRREPTPVAGDLTFEEIDAGAGHTCALTPDGTAYCWGQNQSGELGDGTTTDRSQPVAVETDLTFEAIDAGSHTCALTRDGSAYCWGGNDDGQLGDGTTSDRTTPTPVAKP